MDNNIIELPRNFIGKHDKESLESYGGHHIARGRATRFHWDRNADGDPIFEIYRGGADEKVCARIGRDRRKDAFYAENDKGEKIITGSLEHLMIVLEERLAREHGELQ